MDDRVRSFGDGQAPEGEGGIPLPPEVRLAVLRQTGLSATPDEGMERFARLVASLLDVPVALVSLVEVDRQVFPGMVGLAEPWASSRQTPLSHSLCQHVTASGSPLVLPDVRVDERTCASLAISDLGVVAYAGMPITDGQGRVLGSLCAIDQNPRGWSRQELADLADLAAACSGEVQLRILSQVAWQAQREAVSARQVAEAAQLAAETSDATTRAYSAQVTVALDRAQLMLRAAEDLADTTGLVEVRRKVRHLVSGDLKPSYVGFVLLDGEQLRRVPDPESDYAPESRTPVFPVDSPFPSARAVREGQMVVITDCSTLVDEYGPEADAEFDAAAFSSAVCVPLPGTTRTLGALVLGWPVPRQVDVTERAVLTAIAGYTARAIERALYLEERVTVAHHLQQAMLTDLPVVPGLQIAASYRPAAAGELVGGDWYDAYPLPARADRPGPGPAGTAYPIAVTVGDIAGHDMHAAAVMGQIRSMLRQADMLESGGPATAVKAVEDACNRVSLDALGTVIHAHLCPVPETDSWQFTWTNAGHPPPLLSHSGGPAEPLPEHDLLLGAAEPAKSRTDWQRLLVPGDTLLLYTDGLVEHRHHDIDAAISQAGEILAAAPPRRPLPELLSQIIDSVAVTRDDDIVVMALRLERPSRSWQRPALRAIRSRDWRSPLGAR
jgi:GAF domain-containing protein